MFSSCLRDPSDIANGYAQIRHGESTHNVQALWSGCTECPLTERGTQQARAVGAYFANTKFTKIYASPLPRARDTAQAVLDAQPTPKPSHDFTIALIREQSFGAAEGHQISIREPGKTLEAHFAEEKYPFLRGERAVREVVLPHVASVARSGRDEHIALVSHGLCIAQVTGAIVRLGGGTWKRKGPMVNTGWVRVEVQIQGGIPVEVGDGEVPPVEVIVTDEGRADHLEGLLDGGPLQGMKAIMGGGVVVEGKNANEAEAIAQTSSRNRV
ncbi:phosphoglycerate mutase [Suillus clintonianus]|uniref:phosphoglycerate mutase n=1 Tax=Suillus clintonianus TaxID=1904413 RepID=UPI001B878695|nr:phosphoglycerate mutase [Suillus clintonianus]KAG2131766.1 phosphoglycerate mutase [Suillus clintonianus]